jgi:hypothetical protein
MRAVAVDADYSRSGAVVPTDPADASEGGIRAAENWVTGGNWTQDFGSGTMLDDTYSTSPTIKLKWYGKSEYAS